MNILGIDPGTTDRNPTGYALVDTVTDTVTCYGLLKPRGDDHIGDLARQLRAILNSGTVIHRIAIEAPWVGVNAQTGLLLAQLVGAYRGIAALSGRPVQLIQPTQAKAALCNGRATKNDMRYTVQLRYGLAVPSHVADAIAVALASVTYADNVGLQQEPTP